MAKPKLSSLGKGLDSIFVENLVTALSDPESDAMSVSDSLYNNFKISDKIKITTLNITDIQPNADQPRKTFSDESIAGLAESITAHGVIQPLIVRKDGAFYSIVAGERRWRAASVAGLAEVPAIVVDIDGKKAAELALIENIQREDLNALDEAAAFKKLMREYNLTQDDVSKTVGRSRSYIANAVRLLDLPESVRVLLADGAISAGHARTLLTLGSAENIEAAADEVVKNGLSVRETEELVKAGHDFTSAVDTEPVDTGAEERISPTRPAETVKTTNNILDKSQKKQYTQMLAERFGRKIKISDGGKRSVIEIEYDGTDDLENIVNKLCGDS
jgi:ParB family chromosome partitioning protein